MCHLKKTVFSLSYSLCNYCFGFLLLFVAYTLLISFVYAYILLFVLVTLSVFHVVIMYNKHFFYPWLKKQIDFEYNQETKVTLKELKMKLQNFLKLVGILALGIGTCYFISILFGAPLFESCFATLYFSCLMTLLTVYPLCWYIWYNDIALIALVRIALEFKYDNLTENHLSTMISWSVIGAWIGAFPIPLDWDRPWQEWPITCCIGAVLGYSAAHFFIGASVMWNSFKERKKMY